MTSPSSAQVPAMPSRRSLHILVSSMSAAGRSVKVAPQVARILNTGGWKVAATVTTVSEDPRSIAAHVRENVVAAIGGDGYLAAVARGCHDSGKLFVPIPGGRGNDLCRSLGIGVDPLARARSLAPFGVIIDEDEAGDFHARIRPLDGMWVDDGNGESQLVLGIVSLGLDATANLIANESSINAGPLAYGYGAFSALRSYKPTRIRARVDGVQRDLSGWIASVSNSGCFGGGVRLTADSDPHDGHIELCHVGDMPLSRAIPYLAKAVAVRTGVDESILTVTRVSHVEFLEAHGIVAMADGDRVATAPFTVEAAPHVVDVLV
ncbi:diacylglycerol/lipid kinase family protein [Schaalia sp. ZJ405]|uniref:diacylglycerol/lipid kinase family protein n=1 Tax=Schaalia sp. ZJ405 TaxID=2709403 RepID=UPI001E5D3192|nr:diacylglycerol kinase family protein [Schaalia sp. ZJ405]